MADQLEIHEGENRVINFVNCFPPLFKISRYAEGGDYIKFGNLSIKSCQSPRLSCWCGSAEKTLGVLKYTSERKVPPLL